MNKNLAESLAYSPAELGFGTSGLRGLVSDMTDLECYINTCGFINFLERHESNSTKKMLIAGDLRDSTPRIMQAVATAVIDSGWKIEFLGKIPTQAAAYFGLRHGMPVSVVTGSHIPADRNGIKFYKRGSEVLKTDELAIKEAVAEVRRKLYSQTASESKFHNDGSLRQAFELPSPNKMAASEFLKRYTDAFQGRPLENKTIVVYQHSSVAADLLVDLLGSLGAEVKAVDRAEKFIPIDTENVTPQNQTYFRDLARKYPDNFAIVSADGDADRPFVIDECGIFHRGDILGAIAAVYLKAGTAIVPVSANDAIDTYLANLGVTVKHTKVGSPHVISAMQDAVRTGKTPVVGWEVNGGFLTGSDIKLGNHRLIALPTRDAFLPLICALVSAIEKGVKLSGLFADLPQRYTQAGLLDNFPIDISQAILQKYAKDSTSNRRGLENFFRASDGFGVIGQINSLDGVRITFSNGDIAHVRPSGNAPQLRIYSVANSQKRADEIVAMALAEPNGILRQLEKSITQL